MRWQRAAMVAAVCVSAVVMPLGRPVAAQPLGHRAPVDAPPLEIPAADHRVYMVSESVGLGAKSALPAAFGPDWQVTVDGTPALFVEQLESKHVRPRMADSPWVFGDVAIVAGGHNYPFWDPARFDRSIDSMLAALRQAGAKHLFWVTLREVKPEYISASAWQQVQPYAWYFPIVNEHLRRAAMRHPDLTLIDWTSVADRPGITYDAIHLNPAGAALYSRTIVDTVLSSLRRPTAGTVHQIGVVGPGLAPAGTAAVAVNLTVTDPRVPGFLTAYPCGGDHPNVSNANFIGGQIAASAAIVPVAPDGSICVFPSADTHVLVDVSGAFPAGAGFVPVAPRRLADTRESSPDVRPPAGQVLRVPVTGIAGVPADASSVAVTVTATESTSGGFATVVPCDAPTTGTSTVNFSPGATVPNLAIVAPGVDGAICVSSNVSTHLIVDLFGAFTATADVGLVTPTRVLDTRITHDRSGIGGVTVLHMISRDDVPDTATAVVINLTSAAAGGDGFVTAYPCAQGRPTASNLNVRRGIDRANLVIAAPDANGELCVFTSGDTDLVVDLLGWIGSGFVGVGPTRLLDTR